jgi:hypothetical protein
MVSASLPWRMYVNVCSMQERHQHPSSGSIAASIQCGWNVHGFRTMNLPVSLRVDGRDGGGDIWRGYVQSDDKPWGARFVWELRYYRSRMGYTEQLSKAMREHSTNVVDMIADPLSKKSSASASGIGGSRLHTMVCSRDLRWDPRVPSNMLLARSVVKLNPTKLDSGFVLWPSRACTKQIEVRCTLVVCLAGLRSCGRTS